MAIDTLVDDENTATKQADGNRDERGRFRVGNIPKAGFHTNPERRKDGSWKKEDTPRYKLEQMMMLTEAELTTICKTRDTPLFERRLAQAILDGSWTVIREMIHEVYGNPKESVDVSTRSEGEPILRGFVIPSMSPELSAELDAVQLMYEKEQSGC